MWKHGVALAAAAMLWGGALSAQERQPEDQQNRARANQPREGAAAGAQRGQEGRQGQMAQRVDQSVAAMLAIGNYCEIQLGQLASQKSQNPQVKEFAQQMVQDHTQFLQKIQPFLPPGQFDDLKAEGSPGATRTGRPGAGARPEGAAAARPEGAPNEASDQLAQNEGQKTREGQGRQPGQQGEQGRNPIWQIQKEAGQKALAMTKEILNEKQGDQFDKCYIGGAITAHVHSLAKLEAAQNHVSPEFQQVIQQGQQTTEQHLKHARTLAQQLEGEEGAQPGQPPRAQPGATRPGAQPGARPAQPGATRPAQPGTEPKAPRTEEP